MNNSEPTDQERYPTLSEHGRALLQLLREHPAAPIYRNQSGNRLTTEDVERVRAFDAEVAKTDVTFQAAPPSWVDPFLERCYDEVPYYQRQGSAPARLEAVRSVSRADFARDIAAFVPNSAPLERLINYRTTGTTGHPLLVASHPVVAASYLSFHKRALRRFGVELLHRRGQVGVALIGFQKQCFTYVSVTPTMDDSGLAKINLHPDDWRTPSDRARYLEALDAEVLTGDPLSFAELLRLDVTLRPRALLSTSMTLLPALRGLLEQRFQCPVLDVYSLNEAGPIAVFDPEVSGHVLLQHRLYVEILDPDDQPVALGQRGEITLTGGFNCCLPLVRYRTGDFAELARVGNEPVLRALEGRSPVTFRTQRGESINNIDVTHVLKDLPLAQFSLQQRADGSLDFSYAGTRSSATDVRERLLALFGQEQLLRVHPDTQFDGKIRQYESALS